MEFSEYILNFLNIKDAKYGGYILLFGVMLYFLQKSNNLIDNKKVGILNIIVFLLCFFNILDSSFVLLIYLIVMFINFIVLKPIMFKESYLKHPLMFVIDFIYKLLVDYGFIYLFISLVLGTDYIRLKIPEKYLTTYLWITLIIAGYFVIRSTICSVNKDDFKVNDLNKVFNKISKQINFDKFNYHYNNKFITFCSMIINREDNSYFARLNSYNWFSLSFIWYRIKRFFKYPLSKKITHKRFIGIYAYIVLLIWHTYYIFLKTYDSIFDYICRGIEYIIRCIRYTKRPHIIRKLFRGYSTIEMQLIRTLAVDHKSYSLYPEKRKIFELCYSYIFFNCLKDYFKQNGYCDSIKYKYYLLYIYMLVAPSKLGDKEYESIFEMYNKKDILDISCEEFFIWLMGLSHCFHRYTVLESNYVNWYKLDIKELDKLITRFET